MSANKTEKPTQSKTSDAKFTVDIHFRLTEDERRIIQTKADELGCSLSQAARVILFRRAGKSVSSLSKYDREQSRLLAVRGVRSEFQRIATSYNAYVDSYLRSVRLTDKAGNPVVNTAMTTRLVGSLESLTLKLQSSLNELCRQEGVREEHAVARVKSLTEAGEAENAGAVTVKVTSDEIKLLYSNMERIMIMGRLAEDATVYRTEKGTEKVRFKVSCESVGKGGFRTRRSYAVYAIHNPEALPLLKTGKTVFAEGTFAQDDKGGNMVFADVLKFVEP